MTRTYADDASLGRFADTVRPVGDSGIVMESEYVNAKFFSSGMDVRCEFNFRNPTDREINILMGFPIGTDQPGEDRGGFSDDTKLHDFSTVIDGQKVDVEIEKGFPSEHSEDKFNFPEWYTWNVNFKPGQSRKVVNTYRVKNYYNSIGQVHLGYVLVTGAVWEGNIGYAKISFDMGNAKPYHIENISPAGFRFEGDNLVWEFRDFEPTENVRVIVEGDMETRQFAFFPYESGAYAIQDEETKGNYTGALELTEKLIRSPEKLSSDNIAFLFRKKYEYLERMGRRSEGIAALEKCVSDNYMEDGVLYYLLKHYAESGNKEKYVQLCKNKVFDYAGGYLVMWARQHFTDSLPPEMLEAGNGDGGATLPEIRDFSLNCIGDRKCEITFTSADEGRDLNICNVDVSYTDENGAREPILESYKSIPGGVRLYNVKQAGDLPPSGSTIDVEVVLFDFSGNKVDRKISFLYTGEQLIEWKTADVPGLKVLYMEDHGVDWNYFANMYGKIAAAISGKLNVPTELEFVRIYPDRYAQFVSDGKNHVDVVFGAEAAGSEEQWIKDTVYIKAARRMLINNFGMGWGSIDDRSMRQISAYMVGDSPEKGDNLHIRLLNATPEKLVVLAREVGNTGNAENAIAEVFGKEGIDSRRRHEDGFTFKLILLAVSFALTVLVAGIGIWMVIAGRKEIKRGQDV